MLVGLKFPEEQKARKGGNGFLLLDLCGVVGVGVGAGWGVVGSFYSTSGASSSKS